MDKFLQNGAAAAAPAPAASGSKKGKIEQVYQKKTQLEHILLRPDTYIGSVEHVKELMWVFDKEEKKMVQREISYVPGLYKIFDEILVNAADNKQRDATMTTIKIDINQEKNEISVWNNGQGIPVVVHKEHKCYVPTMIFGQLLTSSNYNDEEEKVTGGRNGYGAKLCNIFSTRFQVETSTKEYHSQFKQTWADNMAKVSEAKVTKSSGSDYTKITFSPDLTKFKMTTLDDDIVALMNRRAYDVAASTRGISVFLNGEKLPIKTFQDYTKLYLEAAGSGANDSVTGAGAKICYEKVNERWEVAFAISERGFQQVSFVNSIATTKGGRHVDHVADAIVKQVVEQLKKKNKGGVAIKPFEIRNHMWVFVNCLIVNPTFDSQTKENMTTQAKSFGSKCPLSEKFCKSILKLGIVERIMEWAQFKQAKAMDKQSGRKASKLKGIPKLEDANEAGGKNSLNCTLILTEGDSAKALAMCGLGVIGRDYYGVFPLRGKLLNVREATYKQRMENAEINSLVKIIGLQYNDKYTTQEEMKKLRYGKVMIMTDQDQDGSHIKGLVINFIHNHWPNLLRNEFLEEFITPIVKAKKSGQELCFYSIPEFEEWRTECPTAHRYTIKYYKGLGTSTAAEATEYFENFERHRIKFRYDGSDDDAAITMAFAKEHVQGRKQWLTTHMEDCKRRKDLGLPDQYLYQKDTKVVSYKDFINLELVLFSNMDNERSIPNIIDGFKPGQRKIMFTGFATKALDKEIKVAQLSGLVSHKSQYHHGEMSLCGTIVNLAQNYVGSNNINLLVPEGQFGTRLSGGKDSASARYIHTFFSPLTRLIFHPQDEPLLDYLVEDNIRIEPTFYVPIIPMALVNGAEGIGTGWATKIPNHNPRDLIKSIRLMLGGQEPLDLKPWYKNFKGEMQTWVDRNNQTKCVSVGNIAILDDSKLEITELPIGTWTQVYKENVLEPLSLGSEKIKSVISDYKEYNTDKTIRFVVTLKPGALEEMQSTENGLYKTFKLTSSINCNLMYAFDESQCLRKFDTPHVVLREYFALREKFYKLRKEFLIGMMEAQANQLSARARFIMEKCNGTITVENKKRAVVIEELVKRGYPADPVAEWKGKYENVMADDKAAAADQDDDEEEEEVVKPGSKSSGMKTKHYDYLVGMSMWFLTDEKKNELLKDRDVKLAELNLLKGKSIQQMWLDDLDVFEKKLNEVEDKERLSDMEALKTAKRRQTKTNKANKAAGGLDKKKRSTKNEALNLQTMPSADATKIEFRLTESEKARFLTAAPKVGGEKIKKEKKEKEIKTEEGGAEAGDIDAMDAMDALIAGKAKKPRVKKEKPEGGDGLKQSKLNFSGEAKKKAVKKPRKKKTSDDEDDDGDLSANSDVEFVVDAVVPARERPTARNASKKIAYKFSDDEDEKEESDGEPEMHDNRMNELDEVPAAIISDSDAEDGAEAPTNGGSANNVSSSDMFDSLREESTKPVKAAAAVKKAPAAKKPAAPKRKPKDMSSDDELAAVKTSKKKKKADESDDDFTPVKKRAPAKKKGRLVSDSESDYSD